MYAAALHLFLSLDLLVWGANGFIAYDSKVASSIGSGKCDALWPSYAYRNSRFGDVPHPDNHRSEFQRLQDDKRVRALEARIKALKEAKTSKFTEQEHLEERLAALEQAKRMIVQERMEPGFSFSADANVSPNSERYRPTSDMKNRNNNSWEQSNYQRARPTTDSYGRPIIDVDDKQRSARGDRLREGRRKDGNTREDENSNEDNFVDYREERNGFRESSPPNNVYEPPTYDQEERNGFRGTRYSNGAYETPIMDRGEQNGFRDPKSSNGAYEPPRYSGDYFDPMTDEIFYDEFVDDHMVPDGFQDPMFFDNGYGQPTMNGRVNEPMMHDRANLPMRNNRIREPSNNDRRIWTPSEYDRVDRGGNRWEKIMYEESSPFNDIYDRQTVYNNDHRARNDRFRRTRNINDYTQEGKPGRKFKHNRWGNSFPDAIPNNSNRRKENFGSYDHIETAQNNPEAQARGFDEEFHTEFGERSSTRERYLNNNGIGVTSRVKRSNTEVIDQNLDNNEYYGPTEPLRASPYLRRTSIDSTFSSEARPWAGNASNMADDPVRVRDVKPHGSVNGNSDWMNKDRSTFSWTSDVRDERARNNGDIYSRRSGSNSSFR